MGVKMNITHVRYAVEVAKLGSVARAADKLLTAQPNVSRAIKELEADLGISIFERSTKGMVLTTDGEDFIAYAEAILRDIDGFEAHYKNGEAKKERFSISVPRASYISDAFSSFTAGLGDAPFEFFYKETNSERAISNILTGDYKLGIIRYREDYDKSFKSMLEEKGLLYEVVAEFTYVLVMNKEHPLATKDTVSYGDLSPYTEIAHADPYVPSLPMSRVIKEELPSDIKKRIFVFERASQFDILSKNPETFMWVSPIPSETLERYSLVEKRCADNDKVYKDLLIWREGYKLTKLDKEFITALCNSRRKLIN